MPIANYPFKGPFRSVKKIDDISDLFVVLSEFRARLIRYAVLYEDDFPSKPIEEIEEETRKMYRTIPCGGDIK